MERALILLDRMHRRRGGEPQRSAVQDQGLRGERTAYFYLRRAGYLVVARRWRLPPLDGEVDLIAWDGETLCFVEVKTRGSRTPFAAEMTVDAHKQQTLRRMADAYIRQLPWTMGETPSLARRFDVVSVYIDPGGTEDVRLLRNFFV